MEYVKYQDYVAKGYNRIPIYYELLADLDTPLSIYMKLADEPNTYLLESVEGGEKWGRYSIIGLSCKKTFRVYDQKIIIKDIKTKIEEQVYAEQPFDFIEGYRKTFKVPVLSELPSFYGGLVGCFGYDSVRYIEKKISKLATKESLETPDILLMVSEEVVIFDNLSGKMFIVILADPHQDNAYQNSLNRLDSLKEKIGSTLKQRENFNFNVAEHEISDLKYSSSFSSDAYKKAVNTIKKYIIDGDCMQVVPSQRMTIKFTENPINLYRALRCINPAPYMFFFNFDDFFVVGSSPEVLVRVQDTKVTVRPIAGTRKRGETDDEDQALIDDLLSDKKEKAEHLMLVDLARNDIGRIANVGSVQVTEQLIVEKYSNVIHIVSNVEGTLKENFSAIDAFKATFPAGTLSGAPKVRAMEIINELEPVKRGVYGGAVGWLSWHGNMDTAIAIRTAVIKNQELHIQAGAGIVFDSDPQMEWEETLNKRKAMFLAVKLAQQINS